MDNWISVILIGIAAVLTCFSGLPVLKILQLSGYKAKGVFAWWKATHYDTLIRYAALMTFGAISVAVYVCCFGTFEYARYCAVGMYDIIAAVFVASTAKPSCRGIKFTGRMKRLVSAYCVLIAILGVGAAFAAWANVYCQIVTAALGIASPFAAIATCCVMAPIERANNKKYVVRAKTKLAEQKPVVIGITGSYGKTTAKSLLAAMLGSENTVLATPGSYNTPMGVCKTINDSLDGHKYFIAELGARYKGDIAELCDIVHPTYGIITAVGDMHLETLGTRAAVANAKFELAESLPKSGIIALNCYNAGCAALSERTAACERVTVGEGCDVCYENLDIGSHGTSFDLVIGGERRAVATKLLGAHIAELTCVCATIAHKCGISIDGIASAVSSLEPVEHRLQLIENGAVTVIDDAYNSNPDGAKNALDVLGRFGMTKVIITPGFVELGALEKPANTELGGRIAGVCDYAFLVGSRAADIKAGAAKAGMAEERIKVFGSRDDAVKALEDIDGARVVLFENDLPDNIK